MKYFCKNLKFVKSVFFLYIFKIFICIVFWKKLNHFLHLSPTKYLEEQENKNGVALSLMETIAAHSLSLHQKDSCFFSPQPIQFRSSISELNLNRSQSA